MAASTENIQAHLEAIADSKARGLLQTFNELLADFETRLVTLEQKESIHDLEIQAIKNVLGL